MQNRILIMLLGVLISTPFCFSNKSDSLFIDSLLQKSVKMNFQTQTERLMFFAESMIGTPYKGGTLDVGQDEALVVRTDSLDCTTYVEMVLALYLSSKHHNPGYRCYSETLTNIRYRGGVISGYASRLHYFSDWISENEQKGIVCELTGDNEHELRNLSLNYMTEHPGLYRQLRGNDSLINEIKCLEKKWKDYKMPYIPKKLLNMSQSDTIIKEGDILALTTSIPGLDVVHLGFAVWIDGKLHLLHASSNHGKVLLDSLLLYDYLKNKKKHTGVRVIRVK